jgi:DHA2 family multidrug resistance protein
MAAQNQTQQPSKWLVAVLVSIGVFIAILDTTIVDIVLPKMMASMETDIYGIQWVVITYFLGAAISMTAVGWLAEVIGHRNVYIIGILLFVAMSAMAGLSNSLPMMLTARFFQGVAEGMMIPIGMVILYETFPPEERGLAMGVYGASALFAPALGPTLGGFLTYYLNWRWVFFINIPVGLLDVLAIWLLMIPRPVSGERLTFDFVGFTFLATALSTLIVFLGKGQEKGWLHSDFIVSLMVIFVISAMIATIWLTFTQNPLFPRRIIKNKGFLFALIMTVLFSINAYGFLILVPIYLQKVHGYSTLQAGLILFPGAISAGISTLLAGYFSDRTNPKWVILVWFIGLALTSWVFHSDIDTPKYQICLDYIFWGFFAGGAFVPITLLALKTLEEQDISNGSMVINVSRMVAGAIGTAYVTSVLSTRTNSFFEAISNNLTWYNYGAMTFMAKLETLGGKMLAYFDPDTWARLVATGKNIILLRATSYAFHATYQHLALFAALAAIITIIMLSPKGPK